MVVYFLRVALRRFVSAQWLVARKSLEQARIKLAQAYAAGNKALANAKRSLSRYSGRR